MNVKNCILELGKHLGLEEAVEFCSKMPTIGDVIVVSLAMAFVVGVCVYMTVK